ncbi:MAG TPA: tRNA (adenosine(37)-N6)-dimethylallyltransferase MiaA [Solirubrobacterales bacterium]|nr:tRNA (adenosine(37)-N6)-dimethylallyltransferase MiaA [Solirubrobacterales bacterium]
MFGPTAAGKTGVAIEVADRLRRRGEDPVAVNCDAIQVYRGLEVLSGAASEAERNRLEHRLLAIVAIDGEFSAGRFATLAHAEVDQLVASGRRPIVVGGTGLYLRAALSDLDLRPPVPGAIRAAVEAELAERGPGALHDELDPDLAATVHPKDRKRIARLTELARAGIDPPRSSERLWAEALRHPTVLVGLTLERDELDRRIDARVGAMLAAGAAEEARAADAAGASRTARAAIGFEELLRGDVEAIKAAQRRYARRQLTWMRKMRGVRLVDRAGRSDAEVAGAVVALLDSAERDAGRGGLE